MVRERVQGNESQCLLFWKDAYMFLLIIVDFMFANQCQYLDDNRLEKSTQYNLFYFIFLTMILCVISGKWGSWWHCCLTLGQMSLDTSREILFSFCYRFNSLPENPSGEIGTFLFRCIIYDFVYFINVISPNVINAYLDHTTDMIFITLFLTRNIYYCRQPGFNQSVLESL